MMINSTFTNTRPSALLAQAQTIVTAMTGNAAYPEPWPATVPALAQIQKDLAAFQNAVTATAAGDRTQIAARNAAHVTLATDLGQLALYVLSIANGNQEMLATTGFPLRQHNPRTKVVDVPAAPVSVRARCGTLSGTMVVRSSRIVGAGSYDVQITSADPTVEANWTVAGSYKTCSRMELTGLATLKTWSVRVRALGAAGPGAWSVPVSQLVV